MSLKIMRLNKLISARSAELETARATLSGIETRAADLERRLSELPDTDMDGIDQIVADSDALDVEKRSATDSIDSLEAAIEEMTAERDALAAKPGQMAVGNKAKTVRRAPTGDLELRDGINMYIRTKSAGELDKRFVSTDGSVLIPVDQIFNPTLEVATTYDLSTLVNKVTVSAPSGRYPVQKRATAIMHTVEELAENPDLAKPEFVSVDFTVATYRGRILVSQESIDDSAVDLLSIISFDINTQKINTTNALISAELKKFTAKTVTDLDGLKDIVNTEIDPAYNVGIVATQSWFNFYDKLKDKNDRYMLQPDLTAPSGKAFEGYPIQVIRDTDLGSKKGDMVAFVGDTHAGITEFERATISARWIDNDVYGEVLLIGMRTQVKTTDEDAGYLVTVTASQAG